MVKVFVTKGFDRWLKNHEIGDAVLVETIDLAENGVVAAQLGSGLVKLRIGREGKGKSGGYRTVVAFRSGDRAIYLLGFAKNEIDKIDSKMLSQLREYSKILLRLEDGSLRQVVESG